MTLVSPSRDVDRPASLHSAIPLALDTRVFPMGYPLRVSTNSQRVLDTISQLWSRYPQLFDRPAVRFEIAITRDPRSSVMPRYTNRRHLVSFIAPPDSFALGDLRAGFAFASIPESLTPEELRYYYLEPVVYLLIASQQFAFVHASCISLRGQAILLCGDAGAGKTCLAFACAQKGWTFITGDAAAIVRPDQNCRAIGRPYEIRFRQSALHLFPELSHIPPTLRPNGKFDIETTPQRLGLKSALEGRISRLIFLERSQRTSPSIEPLPREEAFRKLESAICFGDEANRQEQKQTLLRLLQQPVLRLRYSNLDAAEQALRSLAERA